MPGGAFFANSNEGVIAKQLVANVYAKSQPKSISFCQRLTSFPNKANVLSEIVTILNTQYPQVKTLDLRWNDLSVTDLNCLQKLSHVTTIYLGHNNIDYDDRDDAKVLDGLKNGKLTIHHDNYSLSSRTISTSG